MNDQEQTKKGRGKTKRVWWIAILCAVVIIALAYVLTPTLSMEEAQAQISQQMESYADTLAGYLDASDLTLQVELEESDYHCRKGFLGKGHIDAEIKSIRLSSTEFAELDAEAYDAEACDKYWRSTSEIFDELDDHTILLDRYEVELDEFDDYGNIEFVDADGDVYLITAVEITKNGESVYRAPSYSSGGGSGSGSGSCSNCGGSGKIAVKWYEHGDWGETSYTSYDCPDC